MELDEIKQSVKKVLLHSQSYPFNIQVDDLIDRWYEAKEPYIKLFNGSMRMVSDQKLSITLSEEAKERKFSQFLNELEDDEDTPLVWTASDGTLLHDFLMDNKEGFFDNTVVKPIPALKINKGMKLLKCFKYFSPGFNNTRWLQDVASRYIQDNTIEGYLYISVHPLDFLTLSDNNNNWRSCHALDGDYRAGNLSYMVDNTTMVAYLASDDDVHLQCLPDDMVWNNKRWRILMHTDQLQSIIYYNRQYPFDSLELMAALHDHMRILNPQARFSSQYQVGFRKIIHNNRERQLGVNYLMGADDMLYDTRNIIDESDYIGYCDLIYSHHYSPMCSVAKEPFDAYMDTVAGAESMSACDLAFKKLYGIKIGGKVKCVRCGQNHVSHTDTFLCNECIATEDADDGFYLACECCGSRIYSTEDGHLYNGEWLCETCFSAVNKEQEGAI